MITYLMHFRVGVISGLLNSNKRNKEHRSNKSPIKKVK